jgi:hypothetical protein
MRQTGACGAGFRPSVQPQSATRSSTAGSRATILIGTSRRAPSFDPENGQPPPLDAQNVLRAIALWVPEIRRISCHLLILVDQSVESVASADVVDFGCCPVRERS